MATPHEKLASSLAQLAKLQRGGRRVFRTRELTRTHCERLLKQGFLREVIKGWLISTSPDSAPGDTTPWFASFWEFGALRSGLAALARAVAALPYRACHRPAASDHLYPKGDEQQSRPDIWLIAVRPSSACDASGSRPDKSRRIANVPARIRNRPCTCDLFQSLPD